MSKSKIDETIKNLASATSKIKSKNSLASEITANDLPGDPNCPYCHGAGYLRADVPIGHPDFGKLEICVCRRANVTNTIRERLFALSHLDELKDLTFETFEPRGRKGLSGPQADSLEMAFKQARRFARALEGWLLIRGGYGCGKTHLAAAIANQAVSMGVPTLFLTVPDLLDTLRFSFDSDDVTFEERFDEIRTAKLLILDDFGTQNATGWAQEKLFQIVNYRYINRLPTVVTSNLALDEIEARIRSRLSDPKLVDEAQIMASDYRRPVADMGYHELSSLELLANCTFETFSLRKDENLTAVQAKSLKDAYETAQSFAMRPDGWLVFTGDYATGKTHLAAAIANHRAQVGNPVESPPLFIMVPDLLDELRKTFDEKSLVSFGQRFNDIRTTQFLVLDDLSTNSLSPWGREKLFQIVNYRYLAKRPTVITIAGDTLEFLDARINTRLQDARLVKRIGITVPSYHGKAARKAVKK